MLFQQPLSRMASYAKMKKCGIMMIAGILNRQRKGKEEDMKLCMILAVMALAAVVIPGFALSETMVVNLDLPDGSEYRVADTGNGHRVDIEGYGYLTTPGEPMLPAKSILICLPPGARVRSVDVDLTGGEEFLGRFRIKPAPMILPLGFACDQREYRRQMRAEYERNTQLAYSSSATFPPRPGRITGSGSWREYRYVSVSVCPCTYHPGSGKLTHYATAQVGIDYEVQATDAGASSLDGGRGLNPPADEEARTLFVNYDQIRDLYRPLEMSPEAALASYDYVIITTSALADTILASEFVDWSVRKMFEYSAWRSDVAFMI